MKRVKRKESSLDKFLRRQADRPNRGRGSRGTGSPLASGLLQKVE